MRAIARPVRRHQKAMITPAGVAISKHIGGMSAE